ncbi:uncharacterized protein PB18E9.04c-like isoform X2 [Haliotis rubra]|uniref:uncharacterized protein PB18E9.04c-like isoform X2 n=1 Tax=Haliotis rubra TaxID=36100 RepID=UPI001EE51B36|nr:uncharacterized protein PB18E9.04c-like isoform X2 [Haliotis rubra]
MTLKTVVVIGFSTYLNVWFSSVEAACATSGSDVIQMCQSGTTSGSILYIDASTTVQGNELCSCTATQSSGGQVEIYAVRGSTFSSCSVRVNVFKQMPSQYSNIYSVHCLQDNAYTGNVAANTDVMYNMTGPGTIDACVMTRTFATGSTITITCSPKIQIAATIAPVPTTQRPTTQAPVTQGPTTQAPVTQGPTTQAPITQAPTSQRPAQSSAPITAAPTTKASTTPTRTTPSRGPSMHGTTTTSSFTRVRTSTVYNPPQAIDMRFVEGTSNKKQNHTRFT